MADGVAEIQYFAQAALTLVLFYDRFLDDQGRGDDLLKMKSSNIAKSSGSAISPAFTASARPLDFWRSESVSSVSGSISTFFGCQKAPTMFLTPARLIAVLPPIELSTWDRIVVGML